MTSQFTVYFNEAFYEYLCCDSEAVNYVLKSLINNKKDDILSIVMYKFQCNINSFLDSLTFIWSSTIFIKMKTYGCTSWQFFFSFNFGIYICYYYYDYIAERDKYKKELWDLFSVIRQWNILTLVYLFGSICQFFIWGCGAILYVTYCLSVKECQLLYSIQYNIVFIFRYQGV